MIHYGTLLIIIGLDTHIYGILLIFLIIKVLRLLVLDGQSVAPEAGDKKIFVKLRKGGGIR